MKTTSNEPMVDPWEGMNYPSTHVKYVTRLTQESSTTNEVRAFWAKTPAHRIALLLEFPEGSSPCPMPSFKIMNIVQGKNTQERCDFLIVELIDSSMKGLFKQLCDDLIQTSLRSTPLEVRQAICLRLEKWRHLLKNQSKLSKEEQKGLVAELLFLQECTTPEAKPINVVRSWTGPMKAPRDFSFGSTFVEVKANRGAQSNRVMISSENQLSTRSEEKLFLYVIGLGEAPETGFSLAETVDETRKKFQSHYLALEELDTRLAAVGYNDDEDYDEYRWEELGRSSYLVEDDFPRLDSTSLPLGVSHTTYYLDLNACKDHLIKPEMVYETIRGDFREQ